MTILILIAILSIGNAATNRLAYAIAPQVGVALTKPAKPDGSISGLITLTFTLLTANAATALAIAYAALALMGGAA